jgi:hypothetical protein
VVDDARTLVPRLVPVPGGPYDFTTLIAAQSIGDHRSLLTHRRRVLRVAAGDLGAVG